MLPSLFAGCGSKPQSTEQPPQPEPAPAAPTPEPVSVPQSDPVPAEPEPEPLPPLTMEEKQQILVQTALAYYDHNPNCQYDNYCITVEPKGIGVVRRTSEEPPEFACKDNTVYSVCSSYCYDVLYDAFGYRLLENADKCLTHPMCDLPQDDVLKVFDYHIMTGGDIQEILKTMREMLVPGDLLVNYSAAVGDGHAMLFLGDYKGDGHDYIIHCWGGKINFSSGVDKVEKDGSIRIDDVDEFCFSESGSYYLGDSHRAEQLTVLRPLNDIDAAGLEATASAKARLAYDRLYVNQEFSQSRYVDVAAGDTLTVTLTVKNGGKEDYEVPVTAYVPEGQALTGTVSENGTVNGNTVTWLVPLEPGKSAELTYTLTVSGKPGDTVVFPAATVGGLVTESVSFAVGGVHLTAEQEQALSNIAYVAMPPEIFVTDYMDLDYVNFFYKTMFGIDPQLPTTVDELVGSWFTLKDALGTAEECKVLTQSGTDDFANVRRMLLPRHIGGYDYSHGTDARQRVLEFSKDYYRPGDVFISMAGANTTIWIYLGGDFLLTYSSRGVSLGMFAQTVQQKLLCKNTNLFLALRPTQGIG